MSSRYMAARGFVAGLLAGCAALAAMYLAAALTGMRALPDLLQQPILAHMPGPVFGFLIDNLQHAGKVIEEIGLVVAMALALAALGTLAGYATSRWGLPRPGLVAAALAWLVVGLVVLPVAGQGLLGLSGGLTTPVVWALVFVAYWLVWDLAFGPARPATSPSEAPADAGRRQLVTALPLAIGLGSLLVVGVIKVPGWIRAVASPPESGIRGPVPEITPVNNFYKVSKNFQDPVVAETNWSLRVTGLVGRQLNLRLSELKALPAVTQVMTLECISNEVGGNLMSTGKFGGIPLRDLLTMAEPRANAGGVNFSANDGYTESLPLSVVMAAPDILVAHTLDDSPLPNDHGFPARMLIPGRYGMKGPKWLERIELAASEGGGFWEQQGWDSQAVVKTTSRIDAPGDGDTVHRGPVQLAGVAFSGRRGIQAVEWSADGGRTWSPADLRAPLSPLTWVLWSATWVPAAEGVAILTVRARDGSGDLQTSSQAPSFPGGASGYHVIQVTVGR